MSSLFSSASSHSDENSYWIRCSLLPKLFVSLVLLHFFSTAYFAVVVVFVAIIVSAVNKTQTLLRRTNILKFSFYSRFFASICVFRFVLSCFVFVFVSFGLLVCFLFFFFQLG